jgi:asparagine synthase (glutamine-hydrolysing)
MCGIAGIAGLNPQQSKPAVEAMMHAIRHRGPDDRGSYIDDHVALGHQRLSIIDLSPLGHQPMRSYDGNLEIIFNGEMYNYREVRDMITDYPFRSNSDTEVILAAYQKWGKDCLHHFNGMFGLAIWDKSKQELFIARDRLGIKPIYYYHKNDVFVFASEIRALLKSNLIPKKINREVIHEYFAYQTVHAPFTFVKDVMMLMPGHHLTINNGSINIEEYWNIHQRTSSIPGKMPYREVCEEINRLFRNAVELRLVSDVPFGAFLSGGIDSSAVVGMMSQIHPKPIRTFTIAFDESEFSEARYAKMIADKFGTDHNEIVLSPDDFLKQLPEAMNALDHPSGDGPNSYIVSKATRQAGVTMALSGLGGDEMFAGYPIFRRYLQMQKLSWLWNIPSSLRGLAGEILLKGKSDIFTAKLARLLKLKSFSLPDMFSVNRQVNATGYIIPFLKDTYNGPNRVAEIVSSLISGKPDLPVLSQVSIAEISTYMQNVLLRDTDQMSMAVALEVRVPFLDYQLAEFVMGISDDHKYPSFPKKILVESMSDLLPEDIVQRKKMGFVFPWERWLKVELRDFCHQHIERLAKREFINSPALMVQWKQFLNNDPSVRWLDMWLCVVLEHWLQQNEIEY